MRNYILVINPGSTSTKVAIFKGTENLKQKNLLHSAEEISKFEKIADQYEYRKQSILSWLNEEGISTKEIAAVVGRGGLLKPMPGGTYKVTDALVKDSQIGIQGEHASNLGAIIAKSIADEEGIEAFIVDPVAVDEFEDISRISGLPELPRRSLVHALNIKAVSRRIAKKMNKNIEDVNFVVAHLGGGISVAAVKGGRIIDTNNANEGGPFSPERAGGLPVGDIIKLSYSGQYTYKELKKKIIGKAGLVGYLGTNDARDVEKMIENGDEKAKLIFEAMCYQIGKDIGSYAASLCGKVDRIILTGGLAHSKRLCEYIKSMVDFIAPVEIVAGEDEMQSLSEGAYRVITGEEKAKIYEEEVKA
ncbi:butyrate kinase [Caloramator quimbayensis]|uniref:Probable butyrate kinase n=1 Tax=Caloramator quimbayensis TaxID=1147123 RepID=A0A1T4WPV4_9CLOT|nr:butyrate kinase [Caloramator quimbayensis]